MPDAYDEVRYPSFACNRSHPGYVSALAMISGVVLPPVEQWRVLELGCGDASNLLPLAADYPGGRFLGIDRAREPIATGRRFASTLGLANLELHSADLLDWQPEGEFDYIIAHGVYSWVPPAVREKILEICRLHLKPLGIAYISYNALPGCHFRRFAWDLLRFHVRFHDDPKLRIDKAREMAGLLSGLPGEEPLQVAVRKEMEAILSRDEPVVYHDDLAETNEPFYLLDFVAQAARHRLQYLGDADLRRDDVQGQTILAEDWLESRQYGDFLARRRFRETLLCRQGIPLDRTISLDRFRNLFAASRVKPAGPDDNGAQRFVLPDSNSLTTDNPFVRKLLCSLSAIWPDSKRISELPLDMFPENVIADLVMHLLRSGALELRISPPRTARSVGERPVASALVRTQISEGCRTVTNQRHQNIRIEDETGRRLLLLMDGSRDRAALIGELLTPGEERETVERKLEAAISELHRLNLLTG